MIRCDIASTLSNPDGVSLQFSLDASELEAEDEDGDDVSVTNTADVDGPEYTLVLSGSLAIALHNSTSPDDRIITPNGQFHTVGAFEFEAEDEHVNVEDLMIDINEVDTSFLTGDVASDTDAIDRVGLYYEDGTPVLKTNGSEATTSAIFNGEALLQDLDLVALRDEDLLIYVKVILNNISSIDVAKSGMAFNVNMSFEADESEIRGDDSGVEYGDAAIYVSNEGTEDTDEGNNMFVMKKPTHCRTRLQLLQTLFLEIKNS